MSLSLKRKIEKAFATTYLSSALQIRNLTIYEGHEPAAKMQLPALVVYAESSAPMDGMPVETGAKVVTLRCQFIADATQGGDRSRLDAWRDELESAMRCTDEIHTAINTGTSFHVHEARPAEDTSDREETDYKEELSFEIPCEPLPD